MAPAIYFAGVNSESQYVLDVSDGTDSGTIEIGEADGAGVAGGRGGGLNPLDITAFNDDIIFENEEIGPDWGLWISNGTAAGTFEIGGRGNKHVAGAPSSGLDPENITIVGGKALFTSSDKSTFSKELWVTDGTAAGTVELGGLGNKGIAGKYFGGWDPHDLTAVGGEVFFTATDTNDFTGLWVSNGTTSGTFEIGGLNNAGISGVSTNASSFLVYDTIDVGGKLLFDPVQNSEFLGLWASDGTAAGTVELVKRFVVDVEAKFGDDVIIYGGVGLDWGLWLSNGTTAGTTRIGGANNAGLVGWAPSAQVTAFEVLGKDMFFEAQDKGGAWGLWKTDGTAAGTVEISGLGNVNFGGVAALQPVDGATVSIGGKVLFTAGDHSGSYGLWVTDGTVAGTFEIGGINNNGIDGAYAGGLDPTFFTESGGVAYFDAENASGNVVLWASNGTASGTYQIAPGVSANLSDGIVAGNSKFPNDFTGGGAKISLSSLPKHLAKLFDTAGVWDKVSGSNGTVEFHDAQATITGGGNLIEFASAGEGDIASLIGTAGVQDTVSGSGGTVQAHGTQASITGSDDVIDLYGSNTLKLKGKFESLVLQTGIGGKDVVQDFGSTDSIQFSAADFASWAILSNPSHMMQVGANTVIKLNASDEVTLVGVKASSLNSGEFHFV